MITSWSINKVIPHFWCQVKVQAFLSAQSIRMLDIFLVWIATARLHFPHSLLRKNWPGHSFFIYFINVDVWVSLCISWLILRGLEVNDNVSFQWPWGLWDSNWWLLGSKSRVWPLELHLLELPRHSYLTWCVASFNLCNR
jgi:hypothetical protein